MLGWYVLRDGKMRINDSEDWEHGDKARSTVTQSSISCPLQPQINCDSQRKFMTQTCIPLPFGSASVRTLSLFHPLAPLPGIFSPVLVSVQQVL
eukprot:1344211-Rhodomonas_salina.1